MRNDCLDKGDVVCSGILAMAFCMAVQVFRVNIIAFFLWITTHKMYFTYDKIRFMIKISKDDGIIKIIFQEEEK